MRWIRRIQKTRGIGSGRNTVYLGIRNVISMKTSLQAYSSVHKLQYTTTYVAVLVLSLSPIRPLSLQETIVHSVSGLGQG